MHRFLLAIFLTISLSACADSQPNWPEPKNNKEAAAVERAARIFPDAIAPPPYKYKDPRGKTQMALYQTKKGVFWFPSESAKSPRFAYIKVDLARDASPKDIRRAFKQILNAEGYSSLKRSDTIEAPEWQRMHGARYWAEIGEARYENTKVRYWIDLYHNTLQIIAAPPDTFKSWGGPLAPLVMNGYVRDPENLSAEVRAKMASAGVNDQAKLYVILVNRKMEDATLSFANSMNTSVMMMLQDGLAKEFSRINRTN